ncbi:hypothetical protein PMIN06_008556 [Paraphaeosphaeria minitans]
MEHVLAVEPRSDDDAPGNQSEDSKEKAPAPTADSGLSEQLKESERSVLQSSAQQAQAVPESQPQPNADSNVLAEIHRFQRMEACLYKHRKEWETNVGPGNWSVVDWERGSTESKRPSHTVRTAVNAAWQTSDKVIKQERQYERPDIFDPAHICDVDDGKSCFESSYSKDAYDTTIDWGNRRDRLRRTFEWDLDRMFLREELQFKRLAKRRINEAKKRQERRMDEVDNELRGEQKEGAALPDAPDTAGIAVIWAEWYTFKGLGQPNAKTVNSIDVLLGEPIVDDDVNANRFWFRTSDRRVERSGITSTAQVSNPPMDFAVSPVPERIRIRSDLLLRTISELPGAEGRHLLELEESGVVFTRPYKALHYLEEHL